MNQCMGCQAGWPLKPRLVGSFFVHEVVGGYPHEIVACTKDRYATPIDTTGKSVTKIP